VRGRDSRSSIEVEPVRSVDETREGTEDRKDRCVEQISELCCKSGSSGESWKNSITVQYTRWRVRDDEEDSSRSLRCLPDHRKHLCSLRSFPIGSPVECST